MTILIKNVTVIPDPLQPRMVRGQAVAVEGTDVAAMGQLTQLRARFAGAEELDGDGMWLLPGLIDAHTHLYSALTTGMPAVAPAPHDFPQILANVWWRFDKVLNEGDIRQSALAGSIWSLHSGITTMLDHHASPTAVHGSLDVLAGAVEEVGLRAALAYEVSDRDGPASRDQGMAENRRFVLAARKRRDNLLRGLFGLHAVFSMSDETLQRCAGEAADLKVGCHMHMAEHRPEVVKFARTHKQSIPEFLAEIGLLKPGTLLAHTVHVGQPEVEVIRAHGAFNVHNPKSNMGNGVGISPVADMIAWGQPVGLGSDGFYDIPAEMATAKALQTLRAGDPSAFSNELALKMVYDHNARFAGQLFGCRLGKVEPGYAADLILVRCDPWTPVDEGNLSAHLLGALGGGARTALVNGRVVLRDGVVLGVDEAAVQASARAQAGKLWKRLVAAN